MGERVTGTGRIIVRAATGPRSILYPRTNGLQQMKGIQKKHISAQPPAAIILAGGQSLRMGYPKLLLPFDKENTFIEQIAGVYRTAAAGHIVLVLNAAVWKENEAFFSTRLPGVMIVANSKPGRGRTWSIRLGLEKITTGKAFIQNTGNPFVGEELLLQMLKAAPDNGYVSPQFGDRGGHPVLLCGSVIQKVCHADPALSLREILSREKRVSLPTKDENAVLNIQTPETYAARFGDLPVFNKGKDKPFHEETNSPGLNHPHPFNQ